MDYAIIVAGGKGLRMGSDLPKQFLPVGGMPILMRTIARFYQYSHDLRIIVVLPKDQQDYWRTLCRDHHFDIPHTLADGGASRFQSPATDWLSCPTTRTVWWRSTTACGPSCQRRSSAAASIWLTRNTPPCRSYLSPTRCATSTTERATATPSTESLFRAVQTPQVFDISLAKQAFNQPERDAFTDDASVVESLGVKVNTVEGNRENIKITTPFDLKVGEVLAQE